MSFRKRLEETAEEINAGLADFYQEWSSQANKVHPSLLPLVEVATEANKGGKRIRGSLVSLGYELTGSPANPEIIKAGIAYEIFQTAILAHDDVIDQSPTRRGKPTVYQALGGDHYGISQAICIGDIGFFQTYEILSSLDFPADKVAKAVKAFSNLMLGTAVGQMLDVELSMKPTVKKEEDALLITYLKTSTYTFIGPLHLGAILGGADESYLKKLETFGQDLGVAFQIQDDILGIFGDEKTIGKSVTSDVEEGKNTTLITKALEKADPSQKAILDKYYGQGSITPDQMEEVKKVLTDTGALDYSRQLAVQYVDRAKKIIPELTQDPELSSLLEEMADYLVARDK